jgi:hypothetical protein
MGPDAPQLVMPLSLRVDGVFLERVVAIELSATTIQDVAIGLKAKNCSNAISQGEGVQKRVPRLAGV